MPDREKVIKGLEWMLNDIEENGHYQVGYYADEIREVIALLKEQEIMSPDEFKEKILGMFSSIWDCEIDHPVFQDKVGELMDAVVALYRKAVKWDDT
jgi:hypothetical protein